MNILLHSVFFYPSIGGVETAGSLIAEGLQTKGHSIRVVTETPAGERTQGGPPLEIIRITHPDDLRPHLQWADAVLENGPSVKYFSQYRHAKCPTALIFQGPHAACPIAIGWRNGLRCSYSFLKCLFCHEAEQTFLENPKQIAKHHWLRHCMKHAEANVFVSQFLLERSSDRGLILNAKVIGNPFDDRIFKPENVESNDVECAPILFVGRAVSIKGIELLMDGYAVAMSGGLSRPLRIVGDGPLLPDLKKRALRLGIANKVQFEGFKCGESLAKEYKSAAFAVVPSTWEEPFGIVVIEALGCGTKLLVNDRGALPEVAGPWALRVAPTAEGWADALTRAQPVDRTLRAKMHEDVTDRFGIVSTANRYEELIQSIVQ